MHAYVHTRIDPHILDIYIPRYTFLNKTRATEKNANDFLYRGPSEQAVDPIR